MHFTLTSIIKKQKEAILNSYTQVKTHLYKLKRCEQISILSRFEMYPIRPTYTKTFFFNNGTESHQKLNMLNVSICEVNLGKVSL